MVPEPIEFAYFNWLCAKVTDITSRNYTDLLELLHRTEFVWTVQPDQHRASDGIELRNDFLRETGYEAERAWIELPCSVLELLVSFSKRAEFQTDRPARDWFWEILSNLRLEDYRRVSNRDVHVIEDILNTFIWRTYSPNGDGGMFPMRHTQRDQRKIEIWYQFFEYIDEKGL
jgi:hypothetical protein